MLFTEEFPCAAESPVRWRLPLPTLPFFNAFRAVGPSRFFTCSGLAPFWKSPTANGFKPLRHSWVAILPRSGVFAAVLNVAEWINCWRTGLVPAGPSSFPPLQRAQIVELACLEPVAKGLHITHWTSRDLARQAGCDGIVNAISPRTVRQILHDVDLQPHRTRYWRTASMDAQFRARAEKVLWCYANAENLARRGIWTVAVDEVPNFQVLERQPIRHARPGLIERQEFEYIRHGTVNLLLFLIIHTGRMEIAVEPTKDAFHYIRELRAFRRRHRELEGVFLIQDGDPSHTAGATRDYLANDRQWWRPRFTPPHASWLNEAELLVGAFGYRYLKRASWHTRLEFVEHVLAAGPEYNQLYAHPFEWTWTNQKMRTWFAEHAP